MGLDQIGITLSGRHCRLAYARPACNLAKVGVHLRNARPALWFYAAWKAEQWGIFAMCALYTYAWARGIWTHWLRPYPQAVGSRRGKGTVNRHVSAIRSVPKETGPTPQDRFERWWHQGRNKGRQRKLRAGRVVLRLPPMSTARALRLDSTAATVANLALWVLAKARRPGHILRLSTSSLHTS
jgi:hypothetical protein